jgi:hypothetical protein
MSTQTDNHYPPQKNHRPEFLAQRHLQTLDRHPIQCSAIGSAPETEDDSVEDVTEDGIGLGDDPVSGGVSGVS